MQSLQPVKCRCIGGVEVQQNLLVRLQNLCQLEAVLAHTLSLLPHPPSRHLVPGTTPPPALLNKPQVSLKAASLCFVSPMPHEHCDHTAENATRALPDVIYILS